VKFLSFELFVAKRFFASRRDNNVLSFITSFSILGVTLGTAALIITLAVLNGFEREIKEKVIGFSSHIQVQGFQAKPLGEYQRSLLRVREGVPGVKAIAPYVAREAMIRYHDNVDGIFLKGIDPTQDVSLTRRYIVEGTFLSAGREESPALVIGRKLSNRLDVKPGDKVVIFGLEPGGTQSLQPRAMQFRVVGLYESGMAEYDDVIGYTTLENSQKLFQLGDAVTGFDILVNDVSTVDSIAVQVQGLLGYPHYARTVFQLSRNLFSWVELQKRMSPILLALIIVVATVNMVGMLLMFILEKARGIGILKSLGAGPNMISRIFFYQGMLIAAIGVILGNALAFILCWIQIHFHVLSLPSDIYYMSTVPMMLRMNDFLLVSAVALLLCVLTTIVPCRAATRMDVIRILRFG
jgi:lipoprotein-releasing system permease protein